MAARLSRWRLDRDRVAGDDGRGSSQRLPERRGLSPGSRQAGALSRARSAGARADAAAAVSLLAVIPVQATGRQPRSSHRDELFSHSRASACAGAPPFDSVRRLSWRRSGRGASSGSRPRPRSGAHARSFSRPGSGSWSAHRPHAVPSACLSGFGVLIRPDLHGRRHERIFQPGSAFLRLFR